MQAATAAVSSQALARSTTGAFASARTVCAPRMATRTYAKLPRGVSKPSQEPQIREPWFGFNQGPELLNSRAAMIGFFALLLVEAVANKGILELIGVKVGGGLDLPL